MSKQEFWPGDIVVIDGSKVNMYMAPHVDGMETEVGLLGEVISEHGGDLLVSTREFRSFYWHPSALTLLGSIR